MGQFSGKCDLEDIIEIAGGFEKFKGTKLFIGDKSNPLHYNSLKDLVSYFPYIEICGFHDNTNPNNSVIILSRKSWPELCMERYGDSDYYNELKLALEKYKESMEE